VSQIVVARIEITKTATTTNRTLRFGLTIANITCIATIMSKQATNIRQLADSNQTVGELPIDHFDNPSPNIEEKATTANTCPNQSNGGDSPSLSDWAAILL